MGVKVAAASLVAVTAPVVLDAVVDKVLDVLVALVLVARALLVELVPPTAPYSILSAGVSKYAGARLPAEQTPAAHGFDLQHPKNGGVLKAQV